VHDIVNLEGLGIPSVFVASTEFIEAADRRRSHLVPTPGAGLRAAPDPGPEPDEEVEAPADGAIDELIRNLVL